LQDKQRKLNNWIMSLGFGVVVLFVLYACGTGPSADYTQNGTVVTNFTSCAMPQDQTGSVEGHWAGLPIKLVFDQDFYTTNNGATMPSLYAAVASWNAWANLRGIPAAFTISNDGTGPTAGMAIPNLTDCAQSSYTASVTNAVGIWKIRNSGAGANARTSCGTAQTLMASSIQGSTDWIVSGGNITGASILLNFANWNSPGQSTIDVQSLLLHELGHVLGLLHSCNGSATDKTTAPACAVAEPAYLIAVMYPALIVGQLRRSLMQNDYSRVNCLY
jgi:hypothetical protein